MADLGYVGAYGLSGLQETLRRRMAEDLARKQQEFQNQITLRGANRADLELQQQGQLHQAQLASLEANRQATTADRETGLANTLAEQIPQGATLTPTDPAVSMMQRGGRGSLLMHADPNLASTSMTGAMTLPGGPEPIRGQLRAVSEPAQPERYIKGATAKQADTSTAMAFKEQQANDKAAGDVEKLNQAAQRLEMQGKLNEANILRTQAQAAAANAKTAGGGPLKRVEHLDDQGNPVIEYLTDEQVKGQKFRPKPGATTENRLVSAKAVNQTGEDIIGQLSDPKVKAVVGPALGRASSLRDFIGNPPPEFSDLAGSIESYALASMGVHGMRSAEGAKQISHMLDAHHTPESLIAAIRGLNRFSTHLMENEAVKRQGTPAPAPSAPTKPKFEIIRD